MQIDKAQEAQQRTLVFLLRDMIDGDAMVVADLAQTPYLPMQGLSGQLLGHHIGMGCRCQDHHLIAALLQAQRDIIIEIGR